MTFSATEIDGPIDWSSFDVNTQASLTTAADQSVTSLVEATIPAPVSFPGAPAPRFWEMEDARIAYGLVPVGPTDLAHLLMIEYASSLRQRLVRRAAHAARRIGHARRLAGGDGYVRRPQPRAPDRRPGVAAGALLAVAVGASRTRAQRRADESSRTASSCRRHSAGRMDSAPLEDVLFMRDEMANLAWAIERTVESPIEQPAQRYEAPDAAPRPSSGDPVSAALPRYLLSSQVPPNWIPLLPVQVPNPLQPNTPGQILSRLKRGAVLQPDGTHDGALRDGEVLRGRRATGCSTTRRCRARARGSRASAGWRAGPTARPGCGRRSGIRSVRAKGRVL